MKYIISISLILICLFSCQEKAQPEVYTDSARGNIDILPQSINAGDPINISGTIDLQSNKKSSALLITHHSLYSKSYPLEILDGKFNIQIPGKENQLAGELICRLHSRGKTISEASTFISPLKAVDKMQNFNGPKSLFASDEDGSMNVSIPHDKYYNPLLPSSKVTYQASYNGIIENSEQKTVDHLVAYQINNSKKQEGKYLIGSSINEGFSQEQELIIGAVMPVEFSIELMSHYPYADARQYMHLKTSVMRDQWENIVADGTMIQFTIEEDGELVGAYQAFSIGGIANVYIENPSRAIEWKITASLHDQLKSNEIKVSFARSVNDYPLQWNRETKNLTIGPVIGVLGQLVPDGTEVKISNKENDLEEFIFLEDGIVSYKLGLEWKLLEPKQLEILIGGILKSIYID